MHKGIVLKVTNEYAVVLTQDNEHYKLIPREGIYVGQKIFFFEEDIINISHKHRGIGGLDSDLWRKAVSFTVIAACLLFFFVLGGIQGLPSANGSYYAVVSVDINPSVELKISKQKHVIAVEALNSDAYQVAGQYLVGLKVEDAVSKIVTNAVKYHYLKDEETVLIAASVNPSLNVSQEDFKQEIIAELTSGKLPETNSYLFIPSTAEDYKEAKQQKLSLGKYQMTVLAKDKLLPQKVKDMKVKDLLQEETIKSQLKEKNQKKDVWIQEAKKKGKDNDKGSGKDKTKDNKKNGSDEPVDTQMVHTNQKVNSNNEKELDQANKGRENKVIPGNIPKKSPDPPQGTNPGKQDNDNASKDTQKNNEPQNIKDTPDKDNQGDSGVKGEVISQESSSKDNNGSTGITESNLNSDKGRNSGSGSNNESSNSANSGNSGSGSNNESGNSANSGNSGSGSNNESGNSGNNGNNGTSESRNNGNSEKSDKNDNSDSSSSGKSDSSNN